jgi:two-component system chemotaxis response regulator CheY
LDIVIADDEPVTRLLLEQSLISWGYTVHSVDDGNKVLTLLEQNPKLQILLIDWSMPGLNGIELCKILKSEKNILRYVVMLTSKSGTKSVVEAMEAGADDYLTKPFVPEELKVRIRAGCRILEQEKKLQIYANYDSLTGIYNRRMILSHLKNEWSRSNREKGNVFTCILDLDHFKKINDTHGHEVGDQALKLFCDIVNEQIRPYDYFGRYGGEEFMLVMPMADQHDCLFIAERIRVAIAESSLLLENGNRVSFTVSIGCTNKLANDDSHEHAIARADDAAYKAKNEGRNKVVFI